MRHSDVVKSDGTFVDCHVHHKAMMMCLLLGSPDITFGIRGIEPQVWGLKVCIPNRNVWLAAGRQSVSSAYIVEDSRRAVSPRSRVTINNRMVVKESLSSFHAKNSYIEDMSVRAN